ncbi:hypothetical protein DUI87_23156 [Hirundo rustica rustica]|uniref:Uncharacterized protein n=1 Tax=Hirundo rustica rustica TaxID=333673 RepID=A0A3M0JJQ6_HIRRU|nr:hypothetical protein DUI87_23156 [Hirundo rustica rustica]
MRELLTSVVLHQGSWSIAVVQLGFRSVPHFSMLRLREGWAGHKTRGSGENTKAQDMLLKDEESTSNPSNLGVGRSKLPYTTGL